MEQNNQQENEEELVAVYNDLTTDARKISRRCEQLLETRDVKFATEYSAYKALLDPFDSVSNPNGIINMGTAVSGLMDDVLLERFKENHENFFQLDYRNFRYYSFYGSNEFRQNIANFVTKFFKPPEPINYENIFVLNGALVSLDILLSFLVDENEVVLLPTPGYSGYFHSGIERWNVNICPVPMERNEETGEIFELNLQMIEKTFHEQIKQGKIVKAFLLNNPHNPLGKVFSKEVVLDIMTFCERNGLHLIADEIYCLSVFDKTKSFHSILELQKLSSLDKDHLHILWGFSKDLCLTSFRTGFIHTYNEQLQLALMWQSQFQAPSLSTMNVLNKFITDLDWIEKSFVPTHHQRLQHAYLKTRQLFDSIGIVTTPTSAGFFLMADFKSFLNPPNKKNCEAMVRLLYKHKVYLTPFWDMKVEGGWFRIVFTVTPDALDIGLTRIQNAIEEWKQGDSS